MNEETKKKIEQLINQRKEWLIEQLVKFCIELVKEIETLKQQKSSGELIREDLTSQYSRSK